MALFTDFQVQHHAAVRIGVVVVPVLAIEVVGNIEKLLPRRRWRRQIVTVFGTECSLVLRIFQDALTIVKNLTVSVVQDAIANAFPTMKRL